jgi:hypothetical protein
VTAPADRELLLESFASRWKLAAKPAGLFVWTAERTEGTSIRYVVDTSPLGLAEKLAAIEAEAET